MALPASRCRQAVRSALGGHQDDQKGKGSLDIRFDCTQYGRCCHDLRLPLSVDEAIDWAGRGHRVQMLCDALPDMGDPPDAAARYRYERSFAATSGGLPIRVHAILMAVHAGACPHLRADMRCGNYERRPRTCRIYPVEVVPHIDMNPSTKLCPPEAWSDDRPVLLRSERPVSAETAALIEAHRAVTRTDVPVKARACAALRIASAGLAHEGYAIHSPDPMLLADTLARFRADSNEPEDVGDWTIATNRGSTLAMLRDADARAFLSLDPADYAGFFPAEAA
jgi:Fe-S-cluster containining protein